MACRRLLHSQVFLVFLNRWRLSRLRNQLLFLK